MCGGPYCPPPSTVGAAITAVVDLQMHELVRPVAVVEITKIHRGKISIN